jgi:hypothetical protein
MPVSEKQQRADAVIDNAGPPDDVQGQIEALLSQWGLLVKQKTGEPGA